MTVRVVMVLAVALGLWCWPSRAFGPRRRRLGGLRRYAAFDGRRWLLLPTALATLVGGAVGVPVGLSAGLLVATVTGLVRGEVQQHTARRQLNGLLAALRTLAREVRAGAQPLAAITATAGAHGDVSGSVLTALAAVVSSDRPLSVRGVVAGAPTARADVTAELSERLAVGWSLSARHGIGWAGLIDATVVDLADRVRADAARTAQVAGPRVSGYVLALMPGLGLLLGAGMGADPVHVLLGTAAGHLMLLVGSVLTCTGLLWTARIVRA